MLIEIINVGGTEASKKALKTFFDNHPLKEYKIEFITCTNNYMNLTYTIFYTEI